MKRIFVLIVIALSVFWMLAGCGTKNDSFGAPNAIEQELAAGTENSYISAAEIESETAMYVVTLKIKQTHFTLNIGEHIKDAMNEITLEIPVDKAYFDSVSVGDVINKEFRVGSLIMHGSFGNWKVSVENKEVRYQDV